MSGPTEHPNPTDSRGLVTFVVPVKNEEAAIGSTLRSIPVTTLRTAGFDVQTIILDGQSRDSTREVAYQHGGTTIIFDEGQGKGQALKHARRLIQSDYVVMMDGDGTYAADATPRILAPLVRDEADIVMGHRDIRPGAMSAAHKFGNRVLSLTASTLYGSKVPDLCTGMWGFQASALQALPLRSRGFDLEAEMFAVAMRLGMRIKHVRLDYLPRRGASKLTKRDGFLILWRLMQTRVGPMGGMNGRLEAIAPATATTSEVRR